MKRIVAGTFAAAGLCSGMFFQDPMALLRVVVMAVAAYVALILILRFSGKRSLAKLNAFDLVVTVALGSTLATILLSQQVTLAEGVLAFAMLAGLQWIVSRVSIASPWFRKLVRANPRLLVEHGRYRHGAMDEERITSDEVDEAIRNSGLGRIEQVAAVVLETDGSMSVIAEGGEGELTALRSVAR